MAQEPEPSTGAEQAAAMALLIAQNEQLQAAARIAWNNVLNCFTRLQTLDDPSVEEALAAYKAARALQTATAEKMMELAKANTPSPFKQA